MSDLPVVPPRPKSRSADENPNTPAVPSRRPVKANSVVETQEDSASLTTPQVPKRPQLAAATAETQDNSSGEQEIEPNTVEQTEESSNAGLSDTPPLPTKRPVKHNGSDLDEVAQEPPVPASRPAKKINDVLSAGESNGGDAELEHDEVPVSAHHIGSDSSENLETEGDSRIATHEAPKVPASRPQKKAVANVDEFDFEQANADEKAIQNTPAVPALPSSRPVRKSPKKEEPEQLTNITGGDLGDKPSENEPIAVTEGSLPPITAAQKDEAKKPDETESVPISEDSLDEVDAAKKTEEAASESDEIEVVELTSQNEPSSRPLRMEESLNRKADPVPDLPIETAGVETVDDAKEVAHSDSVAAALTETVEAAKDQAGERLEHRPLKFESQLVDSPQPSETISETSLPSLQSPSATKLDEGSVLEKSAEAITAQVKLEGEKKKEQQRVEVMVAENQSVPARPQRPSRTSTSDSLDSQQSSTPAVPKRPSRRPEPKDKEQNEVQAKEPKSRPAAPPKPKNLPVGSRIGALRASLFSDLNNVISSGFKAPPPPPKKIETGEAKVYESQGTQQEDSEKKNVDEDEEDTVKQTKLMPTSSRPRAKGPKRRLPAAAKSEWSTSVADIWHMNMAPPLDTEGEDLIAKEAAKESEEATKASAAILKERTQSVMDSSLAADKQAEEAVESHEEESGGDGEAESGATRPDEPEDKSAEQEQVVERSDSPEKSVPDGVHFISDDLKKDSEIANDSKKDSIDPSKEQLQEEHEAVKNVSPEEGATKPIEPTEDVSDLSKQDVKDISLEKKAETYEKIPKESKIPAEEEGAVREEAIQDIKRQQSDEMEGEVDKALVDTIKKAAS